MNLVHFANVSKTFNAGTDRAHTVIKDVSFTVENKPDHGEFIGILGPSGCGKSTVLRLIAGLRPHHPATTGVVEVLGGPVKGPGAERGMVFQDYTSFDNRTVLDNVAFGLECSGMAQKEREDRARIWIEKVGLSVKRDADKFPHQLSGGMRQRVAIARTLIVSLWRELEATVFFVTHDVDEAVYLGDRVYIFSPAPGSILHQLDVPPPDRPARVMQREPEFMAISRDISNIIEKLETKVSDS